MNRLRKQQSIGSNKQELAGLNCLLSLANKNLQNTLRSNLLKQNKPGQTSLLIKKNKLQKKSSGIKKHFQNAENFLLFLNQINLKKLLVTPKQTIWLI